MLHAHDATDQAPHSRIYPEWPKDSAPPPIFIRPGPPPTTPSAPRSLEEELGKPVPATDMVDGVRLCMAVVSPKFEVHPRVLAEHYWSYTLPKKVSNEQGTYEVVQYMKGDRTIGLLDFGSLIACRVVGRVENKDRAGQIRASLIATLGAVPITDLPRLKPLAERIRSRAPQTDFANLLVAGDYSLELAEQETDLGERATPSIKTVSLVMVTSVPLPAEFQSHAPTSAAQ